nr:alpha-galactosidase [uncultured Akkermansia sp.]
MHSSSLPVLALTACSCICLQAAATSVTYPGTAPGAAAAHREGDIYSLSNNVLTASWKVSGNRLVPMGIVNKERPSGAENAVPREQAPELFRLSTEKEDYNLPSSRFVMEGAPSISALKGSAASPRLGERQEGDVVSAIFRDKKSGVTVHWKAELREGSSYVKETYRIEASKDVDLKKIQLIDLKDPTLAVKGSVPGSPLVSEREGTFAGIELPVARAQAGGGTGTVGFDCNLPMGSGSVQTFTTVLGVWPENQLRRGFLYYLERERAAPYHQFLHYNGWYDDGLDPTEKTLVKTAGEYGKELGARHVKLDGFVLDDGWDDVNEDLWQPSTKKFPHGFGPVVKAVGRIPSSFGIWISPLGGYFGPEKRVQHAKDKGILPEDAAGFDLSCPKYYEWFKKRCSDLMKKDKVTYFKWDKAGDGISPHFMALLSIASELRRENPRLFINTTVGTWPSPFWLNHVDSTWRNGTADVGWTGKGNDREQWITFRDGACYNVIVKPGPLYPLNSIMHHGMVLGTKFQAARVSKGEDGKQDNRDLKNDARIYFGSGANLQELYLTPSMMDKKAWDDIADGARWARRFQDILADVHWVGGNPNQLEPYGYAAWSPRGCTLALRNPDDQPRTIVLDAATVFEPVKGTPPVFSMKASYPDQRVKTLKLEQGKSVSLELQPFEVLVFDMKTDRD